MRKYKCGDCGAKWERDPLGTPAFCAQCGLSAEIPDEPHPLESWADRLAKTLADSELSELVQLMDGDPSDTFFRRLNAINAERNPAEYGETPEKP